MILVTLSLKYMPHPARRDTAHAIFIFPHVFFPFPSHMSSFPPHMRFFPHVPFFFFDTCCVLQGIREHKTAAELRSDNGASGRNSQKSQKSAFDSIDWVKCL